MFSTVSKVTQGNMHLLTASHFDMTASAQKHWKMAHFARTLHSFIRPSSSTLVYIKRKNTTTFAFTPFIQKNGKG